MNRCEIKFSKKLEDCSDYTDIRIKIVFPIKELNKELIEKLNTRKIIFNENNAIIKPYKEQPTKKDNTISYSKEGCIITLWIRNYKETKNRTKEKISSFKIITNSKYPNRECEYLFKKNGDLIIKGLKGITFRMNP